MREVVVVHDVGCPDCSRIARELPAYVTVRVRVRPCRDPRLPAIYPYLPARVAACAAPAVGIVRTDGSGRWWPGLSGAVGLLPVLRPGAARPAAALLRSALRVRGRAGRPGA